MSNQHAFTTEENRACPEGIGRRRQWREFWCKLRVAVENDEIIARNREEYKHLTGVEFPGDDSELALSELAAVHEYTGERDPHELLVWLVAKLRREKTTASPAKGTRRGRKRQYDPRADQEFVDAWQRAHIAGVSFKQFCKDRGVSVKDGNLIRARVRMRRNN